MASSPIFGIDLGTTCSAIAWVERGVPRVLQADGQDLLPSVVCFPCEGEALVGQAALNRLVLEPERTIRSAKRHMGSDKRWAIDDATVSPVDVSARVLRQLVQAAEQQTGQRPERVVITVPAWFTQAQRADTRQAGKRAGLEVQRIINEPTAAALAHAHGQDLQRRALVYDLGGGTFDVSLVQQDGPLVEVQASHGDSRLGGDDFDRALMDRLLQRIGQERPALRRAIEGSVPARTRLLLAAEQAKLELSATTRCRLRVPFLLEIDGEPQHLDMSVERADFEELIDPLLDRTLDSVQRVLDDGGCQAGEVDELLLVGGSTRIPRVWQRLRQRFGLEGSAAIPPDKAVVLGAAIQAAIVGGSRVDGILVDVAPFSLSAGAVADDRQFGPRHFVCQVITPRNTPLPSRHTERFFTMHAKQKKLEVPIFQGAHPNPLANSALGKVRLEKLPPAPKGDHCRPIDVELSHDLDGMVRIRVVDVLSGREEAVRLAADGEEAAELRKEVVAGFERDGLIPGDGSDPDPFHPAQAQQSSLAEPLAGPDLSEDAPDSGELGAFFESVRRQRRKLREGDEAKAKDLLALATQGIKALEQGRLDDAVDCYETLGDELFDLGIYL